MTIETHILIEPTADVFETLFKNMKPGAIIPPCTYPLVHLTKLLLQQQQQQQLVLTSNTLSNDTLEIVVCSSNAVYPY